MESIGLQAAAAAHSLGTPLSTIKLVAKELEKEFEGKEIPRPEFWGGYLIDVHHWEFWQGRKNRTHDRFSYSKVDTEWKTVRLSP